MTKTTPEQREWFTLRHRLARKARTKLEQFDALFDKVFPEPDSDPDDSKAHEDLEAFGKAILWHLDSVAEPKRGSPGNPWVARASVKFLAFWEAQTGRKAAIHGRLEPRTEDCDEHDERSPALRFVCDCVQLIDPSVTSDAIRNALTRKPKRSG